MKQLLAALASLFVIISCKNSNSKENPSTTGIRELASPAKDSCAEPFLFTGKNGVVYLSWVEKKRKESSLKFSLLANGEWAEAVTIASGSNWFVNWADYPVIASDGNDHLVAHYLEKNGAGTYAYDVKYLVSSDNGKSWSGSKTLHDDGKQAEHGFVSMMPYGDNFFVSWLDGRNAAMEGDHSDHDGHHGQMTVRGALLDKNGNKVNEWELDDKVCDCCQTSVAITGNGPIVVYRDRSDEEIRDISITRYVNEKWTEPKNIFPDKWKIAGCPVNGPRADAIGNNLAIAWFSMTNNKGEVKIMFSDNGGETFGNPIRIDEGKAIGRVALKMLDDKTAVVCWMEGASVKAVKVNKDGTKESSVMIASSSEARSSGFPQMTLAGNKLIFAWTDPALKTIKVAELDL